MPKKLWKPKILSAADFHGHICPGLSLGFKAAQAAMECLNKERAP